LGRQHAFVQTIACLHDKPPSSDDNEVSFASFVQSGGLSELQYGRKQCRTNQSN